MSAPSPIDRYIANHPADVRQRLQAVRRAIHDEAPQAEEAIKYGIPTFVLGENLVHFAAFKNHLGFYPTASGILAFQDAFTPYKSGRGSVQFPWDQPLPLELIRQVVRFRLQEIGGRELTKPRRKK